MKLKPGFALLAVFLCIMLSGGIAAASDLDDGISKYTDNSIDKDDELGQKDHNISFIKSNAKSQAEVRSKSKSGTVQGGLSGKDGSGNMNSVVLGPGGSVRGDIIIIDESRGPKTQVVR